MKKLIIISGIILVLFGCAHQPQIFWTKPDYTEQGFNEDKYQCAKEVAAIMGPQSTFTSGQMWFVLLSQKDARERAEKANQVIFEACMQAKGWQKVPIQK